MYISFYYSLCVITLLNICVLIGDEAKSGATGKKAKGMGGSMCPHNTMYASPHTTAGEDKPAPTGKKAKGNGGGGFQARLYSSS